MAGNLTYSGTTLLGGFKYITVQRISGLIGKSQKSELFLHSNASVNQGDEVVVAFVKV